MREEEEKKKMIDFAAKREEEEKEREMEQGTKKQGGATLKKPGKPKPPKAECKMPNGTILLSWSLPRNVTEDVARFRVQMRFKSIPNSMDLSSSEGGDKWSEVDCDDNKPEAIVDIESHMYGGSLEFRVKARNTKWGPWSNCTTCVIPQKTSSTQPIPKQCVVNSVVVSEGTCPLKQGTPKMVSATQSTITIAIPVKQAPNALIGGFVIRKKAIRGDDSGWEETKIEQPLQPYGKKALIQLTQLAKDTQYHFKVKAWNKAGWSVFSNVSCSMKTKGVAASEAPDAPKATKVDHKAKPQMKDLPYKLEALDEEENEDEYYNVKQSFKASLNGQIKDYVFTRQKEYHEYIREQKNANMPADDQRMLDCKYPISFRVKGIERVVNETLRDRFNAFKASLTGSKQGRTAAERRKKISFHGTGVRNIKKICANGLLRVGHPMNPSDRTDDGWFGKCTEGIYVGVHPDYCLKYSNDCQPLEVEETKKIIMFDTLPGKSKHIKATKRSIMPTDGYDSHTSAMRQEWFLFDEAQCCPTYVLKVQAILNRRVDSDDTIAH